MISIASLVEVMAREAAEYKKHKQIIEKIFAEIDADFEKWKEGVLVFEHFESSFNDSSDSDDIVYSGECVWASEDENDDAEHFEQDGSWHEGDCGEEKGGEESE